MEQVSYLALHCNTPLPAALDLPISIARAFFDSKMHTQHVKNMEGRQQLTMAVINRIDGVIKAIGGLGKVLASIVNRR
jgi:hypothetical protein